jgi:succinate-acetate transporter protein
VSTIDERRERASAGVALNHDADVWEDGFARPRVFLQPIAPPSVLGLFGFATATAMVAAYQAGWYGNASTETIVFPFAAVFGGIAQFLAGMWAYRARDAVATAMHGMWGSFWIAFGILNVLVIAHVLPPDARGHVANPSFGFWFVMLAAITAMGAVAAMGENIGLAAVLWSLAVGSGFLAVGYWAGSHGWNVAGGWVLVFSAGFAWYTASAMMLANAAGRTILPLGELKKKANIPGKKPFRPVELEWAEPGIKQGQ